MASSDDFNQAFLSGSWGSDESKSGPGSTIKYTRSLRIVLPSVMRCLNCKTIFDAPCGDLNWITKTELKRVKYVGADISRDLIQQNKIKHPKLELIVLDITRDRLPQADFWLCRDVIFHMSFYDIFSTIFNFLRSDIKYFATTHHAQCRQNTDSATGPASWRRINLTLQPFCFPEPIFTIWDSIEGCPARWLAIWNREQIMRWLWRMEGVAVRWQDFDKHPS